MGVSAIQEQRDLIIQTIKNITRGDWKVLVLDESSKKIIDNVVKEDDILNENIASIERIEDKRPMNPDMDAIYLLSPQPHIVDCLMADFERRRYRGSFLVWTGLLEPPMRDRIDRSENARGQIQGFTTLSIDYFPRESHLITFRDPWSFPILYHPLCNGLVRQHMQELAQKITGICVSLGEYPKVRYYRPKNPTHEASVLCTHLARFVQEELDVYAEYNRDFPPQTSRPQGVLFITDRSMDLTAPVIHDFTYQAMAHDLLPIKDTEKVFYKTIINEGRPDQEEKEMEIGEKDKIWVDNRHRHMKDTIDKLMSDFRKFMEENPHFTNTSGDATSLNAIKDMLAGLPQFQELKEAYSLHLTMAQECMNIFQHRKLPDVASVEQILATGLDEDYKKPKQVLEQLVPLLDDEQIATSDRLRLIMLYALWREEGLILSDIERLLAHAGLPPQQAASVVNLELLGGHATKASIKDVKPPHSPLFPRKVQTVSIEEDYSLSRFETAVQNMLEEFTKGALDPQLFPYTIPPADGDSDAASLSQTSLRSAKPTWARNRHSTTESRQRMLVFVAGGATYSEARACYEVSKKSQRDIFLVTSHMLTPSLFVRQVGDLSVDRRNLDLPQDRPKPKAPAHLFERERPKPSNIGLGGMPVAAAGLPGGPLMGKALPRSPDAPPPGGPPIKPMVQGMGAMSLNSAPSPPSKNGNSGAEVWPTSSPITAPPVEHKKLSKKDKKHGEDGHEKEKKKRHFFGSKKDK